MSEYIVDFGVIAFVDTKSGKTTFNQSIVGELIRCRDCKYYNIDDGWCEFNFLPAFMPPDGYCSIGKLREDKNE